jgi:hypothetical protein
VRYQELCIPLPKSSQLWACVTEEERRKLQWDEPAGREKTLFCHLIRDALLGSGDATKLFRLPYRFTEADYHLGLCALQAGIWEAAREAHSSASDEVVTKLMPGSPIQLWRAHLEQWPVKMPVVKKDHRHQMIDEQQLFKDDHDDSAVFSPLSLTVWHISAIKMHAPLTLLRLHSSSNSLFGGRAAAAPTATTMAAAAAALLQKPKARLRTWMASDCPRTAVWSAAQIARLVMVTSSSGAPADPDSDSAARRHRLLVLNPLAVPGLLMSAIVACSYAASHASGACPGCSPGLTQNANAGAVVDLFVTDADREMAPELLRWKAYGEGRAVWGPSGIPICQCGLPALAGWFSAALAAWDDGAQREFEVFLSGLA